MPVLILPRLCKTAVYTRCVMCFVSVMSCGNILNSHDNPLQWLFSYKAFVVSSLVGFGFVHCLNVQLCQNCASTDCPGTSVYNTTAEQCLDSLSVNGSVLVSFDQLGTCRLYNDSQCLARYNTRSVTNPIYGMWVARLTNTTCELISFVFIHFIYTMLLTQTTFCITVYKHAIIIHGCVILWDVYSVYSVVTLMF